MKRITVELEASELYGQPVTNVIRRENPYGHYVYAMDAEEAVRAARREGYRRALEDLGAMPQTVSICLGRFQTRRWLEREVFE